MCDVCLERIVVDTAQQVRDSNDLAAQLVAADAAGDTRRAHLLAGCVCCPEPSCMSCPYADGEIARHASEAACEAYLQGRRLLPIAQETQRVFEEAQRMLRAEVERMSEQVRAGLELEQGRALLSAQLRQQMPNARQCGSCGFGPIEHMACWDLETHQGQRVGGNARIDNSCPRCGWFSRDIAAWPAWDGTLPEEAADASMRGAATEVRVRREQEGAARREQEAAARREQEAAARREQEAAGAGGSGAAGAGGSGATG